MVNRMSSYFPKGGHSATETELKNMNTRKVKRNRNFDTKNRQQRTRNFDTKNRHQRPQQNYRL